MATLQHVEARAGEGHPRATKSCHLSVNIPGVPLPLRYTADPSNPAAGERKGAMPIDIKLNVTMSLDESALEDALSEYDELTVSELVKQVLDKAIALDGVDATVLEGPNTLDEYDKFAGSAAES